MPPRKNKPKKTGLRGGFTPNLASVRKIFFFDGVFQN